MRKNRESGENPERYPPLYALLCRYSSVKAGHWGTGKAEYGMDTSMKREPEDLLGVNTYDAILHQPDLEYCGKTAAVTEVIAVFVWCDLT